jgi:hypothetical protein
MTGREFLKKLESENKYVFHGSGNPDIDVFEPRQAYTYKDKVGEKDGDPSVFASDKVDYAILMALINKKNCPGGFNSSAGTENGSLKLRIARYAYDQLNGNSSGHVYIFNKGDFTKRDGGGVEYISLKPISSVRKVEVKKLDLPEYIEIFD